MIFMLIIIGILIAAILMLLLNDKSGSEPKLTSLIGTAIVVIGIMATLYMSITTLMTK